MPLIFTEGMAKVSLQELREIEWKTEMDENYKLKFTVLAENHEACGLECEHGLSIFIEYERRTGNDPLQMRREAEEVPLGDSKRYLLDAGQSGVFARNAEKLGIDLTEVDAAFLSHAHYDHADGFAEFFRLNSRAVVYAREKGRIQDYYSVKRCDAEANGNRMGKAKNSTTAGTGKIPDDVMGLAEEAYTAHYIGISKDILENYPERFCWLGAHGEAVEAELVPSARCPLYSGRNSGKYKNIAPGTWLIWHDTPGLERIGQRTGMYRKTEDLKGFVPDDFSHEQSLVLESARGLLIFNSCSHGGVANIVEEVRQALPGKHIYAYIGGFHLKAPGVQEAMNCTEQEVEVLGKSLMQLGIEKIYTGHCTGERGFQVLKGVLGEKLELLKTGLQVEI